MPNMTDTNIMDSESAVIKDDGLYNKKIKPEPNPQALRDAKTDLIQDIVNNIDTGINSQLDLTKIESFTQLSTRRDQLYSLLDEMAADPIISSILETYAEDATEYNEQGKIVWVESDDSKVNTFISYLLETMEIDKHIYKWVHSMIKYGDIYFQLFKQSEYENDLFFNKPNTKNKEKLEEAVKVKAFAENDHYIHYIEAVPNPAELFELTKFGKTSGFIRTDIACNKTNTDILMGSTMNTYRFTKNDVEIYGNDKFVHALLDDDNSRCVEKVQLFINQKALEENNGYSYNVKKGQSLLYNVFKIWRELSLLENSMLLNRITKSAIVRLINVEVGDMPKENVGDHLRGIKALMEQKSAIDTGNSMSEYTNPGPIENNIYVPTYNGKGAITADQIGGDVNVGQLPDIEYFQNKFFGAMRVPKQYFGLTDDGAGFNGGQSLAILSSRYAKSIKRIQNAILQGLTTVINLMLIDKGLDSYVNKFTLHMLPPTTQEEIDRRDNIQSKVAIVNDIMNLLSDVEDPIIKTKILKSLLSTIITDQEVIALLDEQIKKLEEEGVTAEPEMNEEDEMNFDMNMPSSSSSTSSDFDMNLDSALGLETEETPSEELPAGEEELPTPEDLGVDMTDNTNEI